jgi:glycosyltransferase involved in cell wall biosynthesis
MQTQYAELYRELLERKRWKPKVISSSIAAEIVKTKPIRVAIVAASLRYVGGQSVQADLLVQNCLNDEDLRAKLVPIDPPLPRAISWVERVPLLRTLVREPFYVWLLWREVESVDIVHIFSASYWSFLVAPLPALMVAHMRGKKALIHYHSGEARDHLKRFRTTRPLLGKADLLVVPSGYLANVFREFGLATTVVPNIIDLSQFAFRLRQPLRPHLVCTRGFHPYYCVDVVLKAFAEIQKAYPDTRLDLVGGGPLEAELRQLVQELQLTNVEFTGVASRNEIGRFYDRADIFINASRLDNMPVSVLEAFASGTPVVSTEPEGMCYLVNHERTGLLSPPGDAHALANNVLRLLEQPELAISLVHNAREESQRYRWMAVREQWLEVYRCLLQA